MVLPCLVLDFAQGDSDPWRRQRRKVHRKGARDGRERKPVWIFWLHRRGFCHQSSWGLQRIFRTLSAHHSKDIVFLQKIQAAMSSSKKEPWKCFICKRLAKGNAQFCPECGRHWQDCVDSSFVSSNREHHHGDYTSGESYHNQWHGNYSHSQSPRRRQHHAQTHQRGSTPRGKGAKGRGRKGALKGKDGSKGLTPQQPGPYTAPPPPPALPSWTAGQGDTAWPIPPSSSIPALLPSPTAAPSPAEAQLKQVLAVLKQNEESLPPQIQAVMKDTTLKESKHQIKHMHQAVTELGKAQRQLEEALSDRSQSLASWRQFLHASVQRWSEYTKRFQDQEQAHLATIAQARDTLRAAQLAFKEKQDQGGIITVPDEEEDSVQPDVAMRDESAHRINEGLQHLPTSLKELAVQADRDHAEEQTKKRPRTGPPIEEQTGEKVPDAEDGLSKPSFG